MAKKINRPQRLPSKFVEDMERTLQTRVDGKLLTLKEAKFPKVVDLLTRTNGYKLSLEELRVKKEKKKMNKKGQGGFGILLGFFILIAIILALGLLLSFGGAIVDLFADTVIPEIQGIGTVGDSNITQYSDYVVSPVNTFVQSFSWLGGLMYVLGIIGIFGLSIAAKFTMNKWLIGLFFGFALLLILCSIFISNIYEEFYTGTDDFSTRLQEQTLLSYMILHSPLIFSVVIFISGIIMFSGVQQESYV